MNFKILLLAGIVSTTLLSCTSYKQNNTNSNKPVAKEKSAHWQGSYSGILPCADCEGIETTLRLKDDNTYTLITSYLGKELTDKKEGTFTKKGHVITLSGIAKNEGSNKFKIEPNQIKYLDLSGKEITGNLASNYILFKNGNTKVEDKKWQLVELNGKPVTGNPATHYLIFNSKTGKINAKAGCNILALDYSIQNNFRVKFGEGISTMMACPDNLEDMFKEMLSTVDNLSTDGMVLTLNKARMMPLAKFTLVP